jgi:hypothetical protein
MDQFPSHAPEKGSKESRPHHYQSKRIENGLDKRICLFIEMNIIRTESSTEAAEGGVHCKRSTEFDRCDENGDSQKRQSPSSL